MWPYAGCVMGDGWSIAWRLHDAQFWGVPQRRKRIALVADFGGQSAPEILFERKGMRRDPAESGEERKGASAHAQGSTGKAISFQERAGKPGGGKGILIQDERIGALSTLNNQSVCCLNDQGGSVMGVSEDVTGALRAQEHGHQPIVFEPGAASRVGGHVYEDDVAGTVRANSGDNQQAVVYGISGYESNAMKSANPHSGVYEAETARTLDLNGGSPACNQGGMVVLEGNGSRPSHKGDGYAESETMYTLNSTEHHSVAYRKTSHAKSAEDGQGWAETEINDTLNAFDNGETRTPTVVVGLETFHCTTEEEKVQTLKARDYKDPQVVAYGLDRASFNQGENAKFDFSVDEEKVGAQTARGPGAVCTNYKADGAEGKGIAFATVGDHDGRPTDMTNLVQHESIVRRLTPLECERLQGFPDGWTDIGEWTDSKGKARKCSDSARYKALGNSIAIPFWFYILRRMAAQYERPATLGSLFDGIGGFPLCWERCNGPGTAIWASEIEEFPIAVTKRRFGDES